MSRWGKDLERKGVYFADMNTALKERPELVESYFMTQAVPVGWNKFDALHGAFWQGGYLLHVPKGVVLEVPLRVFVALSEAGRTDLSHTLIVADEGSQVTVLEEHLSGDTDTPGLHCGAVEILVADNAHVKLRWSPKVESSSLEFFRHNARLLGEMHSCVGCRARWEVVSANSTRNRCLQRQEVMSRCSD